jgi:hypothetical protein
MKLSEQILCCSLLLLLLLLLFSILLIAWYITLFGNSLSFSKLNFVLCTRCVSLHMSLKNLVVRWTHVYVITIQTLFYMTIIGCHCLSACMSNTVHSTGHQHTQCSCGRSDEQWYLSYSAAVAEVMSNDTCHTVQLWQKWWGMILVIQCSCGRSDKQWYLPYSAAVAEVMSSDTCHTVQLWQ